MHLRTSICLQGEIKLNGHPKRDDVWRRVSAYVEQTDVSTAGAWWHDRRAALLRRTAAAAAGRLRAAQPHTTCPEHPPTCLLQIHTETATVREALLFSARLRLPAHVPTADLAA